MAEEQTESGKTGVIRVLKWLAFLILLLIFVVAGFFVGIYLRIFDLHEINETMRLYDLPVFGEYFVRPPGEPAVEEEPVADKDAAEKPAPPPKGPAEPAALPAQPKAPEAKPPSLSPAELEQQQKAQREAEQKRLTRLVRLYSEMKPKAAADIMASLNDDITIAILQKLDAAQAAKILAEFPPERSARLTQIIYTGAVPTVTAPGDGTGEAAQARPAET